MNNSTPSNSPNLLKYKIIVGITKISLALKSKSWKNAGLQGLTPTQGHILKLLHNKSNSEMRLSEVALALAVTPATASAAIASLAEKNLIKKQKADNDARAITITLTQEGNHEAELVLDWTDFLLNAVDRLSVEEQASFFRILLKIICMLQAKKHIPVLKMCMTCNYFQPNVHSNLQYPHHCNFINSCLSNDDIQIECHDHKLTNAEIVKDDFLDD